MKKIFLLVFGLFCLLPSLGNCSQDWTPFKLSLYPPAVWPRIEKVNGINLGVLGCGQETRYLNGVQLAAFNCVNVVTKGVQIGIVSNLNSGFSGLQISGFVNINNESVGVSVGGMNTTHTHKGI